MQCFLYAGRSRAGHACGQCYSSHGTLTRQGIDLDDSLVLFRQVTSQGQANPDGVIPGRVERLEDVHASIRSDAVAVIDDRNLDIIVLVRRIDLDDALSVARVPGGKHRVLDDLLKQQVELGF